MYVGGKDLWLNYIGIFTSRHAEKYVRKGRLDWPEGAASRESIKAVLKLPRLQVRSRYSLIWQNAIFSRYWLARIIRVDFLLQNLIMQHVDHSAGDLIHLMQGLLKYDPAERITAREALRHPFFTRDNNRRSY